MTKSELFKKFVYEQFDGVPIKRGRLGSEYVTISTLGDFKVFSSFIKDIGEESGSHLRITWGNIEDSEDVEQIMGGNEEYSEDEVLSRFIKVGAYLENSEDYEYAEVFIEEDYDNEWELIKNQFETFGLAYEMIE